MENRICSECGYEGNIDYFENKPMCGKCELKLVTIRLFEMDAKFIGENTSLLNNIIKTKYPEYYHECGTIEELQKIAFDVIDKFIPNEWKKRTY